MNRRNTFFSRCLVGFLAVSGLMFGGAHPAFAAAVVTGAGGGTGWEYPTNTPDSPTGCVGSPNPLPLADLLLEDTFVIDHTGTYTGVSTTGNQVASYVGPSTAIIIVGEHFVSPVGTHDPVLGPLTLCAVPQPVGITEVTIHGTAAGIDLPLAPGQAGSVDCTLNSAFPAEYIRVQSAVTFTFTTSCTVDGNVGGASHTVGPVNTTHVLTGTLVTCYAPPPFSDTSPNPACGVGATVNPGGGTAGYGPYQSPPTANSPSGFYTGTYEAGGATP